MKISKPYKILKSIDEVMLNLIVSRNLKIIKIKERNE
jgi:hypothetical protein